MNSDFSDFIRFFPIFRLFPTSRLLDSTALHRSPKKHLGWGSPHMPKMGDNSQDTIITRPVESKSLKVGKSLKIGKNRINRINFLLDFFRLFGNLLKRSVIGTLDLKGNHLAKVGSF